MHLLGSYIIVNGREMVTCSARTAAEVNRIIPSRVRSMMICPGGNGMIILLAFLNGGFRVGAED